MTDPKSLIVLCFVSINSLSRRVNVVAAGFHTLLLELVALYPSCYDSNKGVVGLP